MKAPYRHITLFARQLDSARTKTKRWRKLRRQLRRIMPHTEEGWRDLKDAQNEALRKYPLAWAELHGDWLFAEPIEEEAIAYAASIRYFCLPWTLAISRSEAESCFIDLDFLARFILDHYQIQIKIKP